MYHEFFAGRSLLVLPILSMLIFAATFVAILVKTWRTRPEQSTSRASLPLRGDGHE